MERIESIILRGLLYDETYTRRVMPFIKPEYFDDNDERIIFTAIQNFLDRYHLLPSTETVLMEADKAIAGAGYKEIASYVHGML